MAAVQAPYVAGFFTDPDAFIGAARASRDKGHANHDGYMPYPIHGFDADFGLKRSWIGRLVLFMLLFGAFCGFMMQFWMMKTDWPIILAGKPYNSWPAFVVITFESGILAGALTNMFACLILTCKLFPSATTKLIRDDLTDDTFALCIPLEDNGTADELKSFLEAQGAEDIALYVPEGHPEASAGQSDGSAEEGSHA